MRQNIKEKKRIKVKIGSTIDIIFQDTLKSENAREVLSHNWYTNQVNHGSINQVWKI